jgi:L-rhamnose isomerase
MLLEYEESGQLFERLAMLEMMKTYPFGAVWDYYCMKHDVPVGLDYITEIEQYEKEVLSKRS